MRAFITGGAGFIGSSMVDKMFLDRENEVTVFDNFCSGRMSFVEHHMKNKKFKLIKGDLLDQAEVRKAIRVHDIVFHFAANPDISRAMTEPDLDLKLSVLATFNVLDAMRLNGIKKIFYTSGSGVYGDVGLTETPEDFGPLEPISMYGATKLGAEAIICAFCHMFDMQSWIFRFANVVGKNQTHGVGFDFISKLKENPKVLSILGDGKQSKSYIHVSDVLSAMLFVGSNSKEKVNFYNVASEDYLAVDEIAHIVIEEMGLKNVELKYAGGNRGWKGDVPVVRFNLDKVHKLGWKAKYSSKDAVRKSIREMLGKEVVV